MIIETRVSARAGLLGNPSDMYGGQVISFLIEDFTATVRVWESPSLTFRLHPQHDRTEFGDLHELVSAVRRHGYYGMQRVLFAACCRFAAYCEERGIRLRKANFTIEYETDIPRQSGLGGSSAIIIATLQALLKFHRVPEGTVAPGELAALALSVETKELGIAAGLQDRVVQAYGGLTYMDFAGAAPSYRRLESRLLPRFGLAMATERHLGCLESGQVHTPVRFRWEQGDPQVRRCIAGIGRCAVEGLEALEGRDVRRLARLMDENFDLRREMFGEGGAEEHNVRLVTIARQAGFAAKLPGSGGAALVLLEGDGEAASLEERYRAEGYRYLAIRVR